METNTTKSIPRMKEAVKKTRPLRPLNYKSVKDGHTKIYLICDVSQIGMGAFLCQGINLEDAILNIAQIHSQKFTPTQMNYPTTDQEHLAVIEALSAFQTMLLGTKFTIVTDYKPLTFLKTNNITSKRHLRWNEQIQSYDFDIMHISGEKNILADYLSRHWEHINASELSDTD